MFKIIFVTFCVCSSLAFPQNQQPSAEASATILQNTFTDDGAGNFNFLYETSNGIKVNAEGQLRDITSTDGIAEKATVQRGSFIYTAPDGSPIKVDWIADEKGFQPTGEIL